MTIRYRVELEDFTVNVSETYKPKREPEKEAPEPKQRPER